MNIFAFKRLSGLNKLQNNFKDVEFHDSFLSTNYYKIWQSSNTVSLEDGIDI